MKRKGGFQPTVSPPAQRYTPERFLNSLQDPVAATVLRQALATATQLQVSLVPTSALPALTILATYARQCLGVELVDRYDTLLDYQREAFGHCQHADLYLASCICILAARGEQPTEQSYADLYLPQIFEQLVPLED